jgi:predicted ATPase/DNA-binding winged helix-turn-helix (wHTH) protein
VIAFGPFRLVPAELRLMDGDTPIHVGSRALGILIELAEHAGQLVSRDELIARVWPDTTVDAGSVRVHVSALRRALGDGQAGRRYITNIPGRGYRFVAPISLTDDAIDSATDPAADPGPRHEPPTVRPATATPVHNIPAPLTRMLGRTEIVATVAAELSRRRLVTIVGPGGIGKTTVALAVARAMTASYADNVRFLDLASLADPGLVTSALASMLGLAVSSDNAIPGLTSFLRDKNMLLVLDNCEHLIDAAAGLAADILKAAPGVNILATSREPLRTEGERVHRLSPLGVPPAAAELTAAAAIAYPAVQLFVQRATESADDFELTDADAPAVAAICRRLDGIALAIELAAGRVDAFGIRGLAELLADRFDLLTRGRRTAVSRHQTLRATLDWSHETLPESERVTFRRLAIFAGSFTLAAASAVAADTPTGVADVIDDVANLAAKSLIAADVGRDVVCYRLIETTRAYALGKLTESGEREPIARRHAAYVRDLIARAAAESTQQPTAAWLAAYSDQIDNVRAALEWAFSPKGDAAIGVALTVAAVPLWMHLSLPEECRRRVEQALADGRGAISRDPRLDMQLFAALGAALLYTKGPGAEIDAAWTRTLAIAETLGDTDHRLRAIWGLLTNRLNNYEIRKGLALAEQFRAVAAHSSDPNDALIGDRLIGGTLFFLGEQTRARQCIEHMLSHYSPPIHRSYVIRFQFVQPVRARATLAEILWLQGFPDQARQMAELNVEQARSIDHALTLCTALGQAACPIALLSGELAAAERFVAALLEHSARHDLARWHAWGRCFNGILMIKQGSLDDGVRLLRTTLHDMPATALALRYTGFLAELADALGRVDEAVQGIAVIDAALAHAERTEDRWCIAELLRVRGALALQETGRDAATTAERLFGESLAWARRQEVPAWELRTATSLARLFHDQGRTDNARQALAPIYGRFSEGFDTADLKSAKALLDQLQ